MLKKTIALLLTALLLTALLLTLTGCDRLVEQIAAEVVRQMQESSPTGSAPPADSAAVPGSSVPAADNTPSTDDAPPQGTPAAPQDSTPPESSGSASEATQPYFDADAYEQWAGLVGYWSAADGVFFIIDMEDSHSAAFCQGVWDAGGGRGYGRVTQLVATGATQLTASVLYPALGEEAMDGPLPETTDIVTVEFSGREQDGKIHIVVNGVDYQCAFAGYTQGEAYQTHLENTAPTGE